MPKPPPSTPHSDIDGVRRDARKNTDSARDAGETTASLALARDESKAKPPHSGARGRDDRS